MCSSVRWYLQAHQCFLLNANISLLICSQRQCQQLLIFSMMWHLQHLQVESNSLAPYALLFYSDEVSALRPSFRSEILLKTWGLMAKCHLNKRETQMLPGCVTLVFHSQVPCQWLAPYYNQRCALLFCIKYYVYHLQHHILACLAFWPDGARWVPCSWSDSSFWSSVSLKKIPDIPKSNSSNNLLSQKTKGHCSKVQFL